MLINELTKKLERELSSKRELKPKDNYLEKLVAGKFVSILLDTPKNSGVSYQQHLENDTNVVQNAPEEGTPVHKRERVRVGTHTDGKPKYVQVSGDNQDERNDNIVRAILGSTRRAEFVSDAIVQAKPEEQPKVFHPLDKIAWEWFNEYLPMKIQAGKLSQGTLDSYKSHVKTQIVAYFGETPLEHIRHKDVQAFISSRIHSKTEEYLSKKVINTIRSILNQIFNYAVLQEYIESNSIKFNQILNPSDKETTRTPLTKNELLQVRGIIPSLRKEQERLYLTMLSYLPYRRCEALGQRWEDVNFDNMTCDVTGDVVEIGGIARYQPGTAKNKHSLRTMIAQPEMMELLKPYRKECGFLLNTNGNHLKVSEFNNLWKGIKAQIPFLEEKGITPYCFRHTYATIMYNETGDAFAVAKQCGHKDLRTTMGTYVHDSLDHRRAMVEKFERALRG